MASSFDMGPQTALRGANWSTNGALLAIYPGLQRGAAGALICSRNNDWNWRRGMARAPRLDRCREGSWQSITATPLRLHIATRWARATLEASRSWLNIDSPKNTPPRPTP